MDNIPEDINNPIEDIKIVSNVKKRVTAKNLSPQKFINLVSKEYTSIGKCNRVIKKLEKFVFSDEYIFGLDTKDLIKLMEVLLKYKHTSLSFLARLYEVSTKNDLLRSYFEEKLDIPAGGVVKSDAKIQNIVNQIKARTKEIQLRDDEANNP